eukprot:TRINITY_DN730_c0_g1_i4.p1 TRINITY_DN730_c0_g1~~TRINITY_DN730_c0_g1_i4.p1  ORF type:complete len:108 (-),score=17.09 TRINITY_DN730_c0_g1_i4:17-340(-)
MCIRDSTWGVAGQARGESGSAELCARCCGGSVAWADQKCTCWLLLFPVLCVDTCLLYTSDAADEEDSVDLGGRRIIKKKKKKDIMHRLVNNEKYYEDKTAKKRSIKD